MPLYSVPHDVHVVFKFDMLLHRSTATTYSPLSPLYLNPLLCYIHITYCPGNAEDILYSFALVKAVTLECMPVETPGRGRAPTQWFNDIHVGTKAAVYHIHNILGVDYSFHDQ